MVGYVGAEYLCGPDPPIPIPTSVDLAPNPPSQCTVLVVVASRAAALLWN